MTPITTEKRAAAFLRDGKLFLHPYCQSTEGFWIFCTPVVVTQFNMGGFGAKVLEVLQESKQGVPHPATWKGLTDPLNRAAKARSADAF
jgi:hypothetical protein